MHCLEMSYCLASMQPREAAKECAVCYCYMEAECVCMLQNGQHHRRERRPGYYFKLLISCASEISTICSFIINESAPVLNEASLQRAVSFALQRKLLLSGGGEFAFPPTAL